MSSAEQTIFEKIKEAKKGNGISEQKLVSILPFSKVDIQDHLKQMMGSRKITRKKISSRPKGGNFRAAKEYRYFVREERTRTRSLKKLIPINLESFRSKPLYLRPIDLRLLKLLSNRDESNGLKVTLLEEKTGERKSLIHSRLKVLRKFELVSRREVPCIGGGGTQHLYFLSTNLGREEVKTAIKEAEENNQFLLQKYDRDAGQDIPIGNQEGPGSMDQTSLTETESVKSESRQRRQTELDKQIRLKELEIRKEMLQKIPNLDPTWPPEVMDNWLKGIQQIQKINLKDTPSDNS